MVSCTVVAVSASRAVILGGLGCTAVPGPACDVGHGTAIVRLSPATPTVQKVRRFATIPRLLQTTISMIETNPIRTHIADLRERVESLRGYL